MTSEAIRSKNREIAVLLMKLMNISDDRSLVESLGRGDEPCNLDAMITLVDTYTHEIDQDETIARLQGDSR